MHSRKQVSLHNFCLLRQLRTSIMSILVFKLLTGFSLDMWLNPTLVLPIQGCISMLYLS
uniref:Uncharacterized protein n=1 Tax=Rhizophora mucronata TaxID=61149 RepID=A0A2P2QMQ1_RHIMU